MRLRLALIRRTVNRLLEELEIEEPPVQVKAVARHCGARIVRVPGEEDDDLSGFLYRDGEKAAVIGVNKDQAAVRQRFTIAHEIGHLLLHENDQVHVDREFKVQLRSGVSSQGTNLDEVEANRFAAELLMPSELLRSDVEGRDFNLADDEELRFLARRYGVSTQALAIRLNSLGYGL